MTFFFNTLWECFELMRDQSTAMGRRFCRGLWLVHYRTAVYVDAANTNGEMK